MHVIEHHDDLFSWKKYYNYKCVLVAVNKKWEGGGGVKFFACRERDEREGHICI